VLEEFGAHDEIERFRRQPLPDVTHLDLGERTSETSSSRVHLAPENHQAPLGQGACAALAVTTSEIGGDRAARQTQVVDHQSERFCDGAAGHSGTLSAAERGSGKRRR
jgi:hypothetical protein